MKVEMKAVAEWEQLLSSTLVLKWQQIDTVKIQNYEKTRLTQNLCAKSCWQHPITQMINWFFQNNKYSIPSNGSNSWGASKLAFFMGKPTSKASSLWVESHTAQPNLRKQNKNAQRPLTKKSTFHSRMFNSDLLHLLTTSHFLFLLPFSYSWFHRERVPLMSYTDCILDKGFNLGV